MPEPITDDQRDLVAKVREALAKATPGPWEVDMDDWDVQVVMKPDGTPGVAIICEGMHQGTDEGESDAHLIAHAPAWLEALCDEVERLRNGSRCPECSATAWGEFGEARRELEIAQMERSDAIIRAEAAEGELERLKAESVCCHGATATELCNAYPSMQEVQDNEKAIERVRTLAKWWAGNNSWQRAASKRVLEALDSE